MRTDNLSAFPLPAVMPTTTNNGHTTAHTAFQPAHLGMTLLDYFAGQALVASLSHTQNQVLVGANDQEAMRGMAEDCYDMASHMLKARGDHI